MTERERLYELIEEAENKFFAETPYGTDSSRIEKTVEHLLANGAIVMPCKTGDEVYRISKRHGKWVILPREVGCITYSITYQNEVVCLLFTTTLDVLGVTVFLTREEAKDAIRRKERKTT